MANWKISTRILRSMKRRRIFWLVFILLIIFGLVLCWKILHKNKVTYDRRQMSVRYILWWNSMPPNYESKRFCGLNYCEFSNNRENLDQAKVILFYGSSMTVSDFPLPRKPNQLWALFHEESPRNVPFISSNAMLQHFNLTSTFSRYSDFPLTTHHLPDAHELTAQTYIRSTYYKEKLMAEKSFAPVAFLQSDCDTLTRREDYVRELMHHINIDSYGSCLHNRDLPESCQKDYLNNLYSPELLKYLSKYYFVIAIENGVCHDYITEKFWRPLIMGTIPIYFGSPTIRDWAPTNKSAIYIEDFDSPKALADFLYQLMDNDVVYNSYFDYKFNQVDSIANQRLRSDLLRRSNDKNLLGAFECQVCEAINREQVEKNKQANIEHYNCPLPPPYPTMKNPSESSSDTNWESIVRLGQCQAQVINELLNRNVRFTKDTFDGMLQQRIEEGFYASDDWTCAKN